MISVVYVFYDIPVIVDSFKYSNQSPYTVETKPII